MKKLLLVSVILCYLVGCSFPETNSVYPTAGKVAKVNTQGTLFGLRENECPFADSATSISLYASARGVQDKPAIEAMVKSGRVIFLPVGAFVDVIENDQNNIATKVRIRSGENIGREMWTHPTFVTSVK